MNDHIISQLSAFCCVNNENVKKSAERDNEYEAEKCKTVKKYRVMSQSKEN